MDALYPGKLPTLGGSAFAGNFPKWCATPPAEIQLSRSSAGYFRDAGCHPAADGSAFSEQECASFPSPTGHSFVDLEVPALGPRTQPPSPSKRPPPLARFCAEIHNTSVFFVPKDDNSRIRHLCSQLILQLLHLIQSRLQALRFPLGVLELLALILEAGHQAFVLRAEFHALIFLVFQQGREVSQLAG